MGCRRSGARSDLLRFVLAEVDGVHVVAPDPGRRSPGRGAWLHPDPRCLELAVRRRAFVRALRHQGPVDTGAAAALMAALQGESQPLPTAAAGTQHDQQHQHDQKTD